MKHISGPWVAHYDDNPDSYDKFRNHISAPNTGGVVICKVQTLPEGKPHAFLIAVAPELLEFCHEIARGWYKDSDLSSLMETYQVRARVLIAKAEGKE